MLWGRRCRLVVCASSLHTGCAAGARACRISFESVLEIKKVEKDSLDDFNFVFGTRQLLQLVAKAVSPDASLELPRYVSAGPGWRGALAVPTFAGRILSP